MKITGNKPDDSYIIDSIGYRIHHDELVSLEKSSDSLIAKLVAIGYIDAVVEKKSQPNESEYWHEIKLNNQIRYLYIYSKSSCDLKNILFNKRDSITIPFLESKEFLNNLLNQAEQNGFSMVKFKLENMVRKSNKLVAELVIDEGKTRLLNSIVIKYKDENTRLPQSVATVLNKRYQSKLYNKAIVTKIYDEFQALNYVSHAKYPEILFSTDSTQVFVYLQKRKSNQFDGYVGFTNTNSSKLTFNGLVDLKLSNALKSGENIGVYWKSDGNDQKTFVAKLEIPYLFKSCLTFKGEINIFRKDSTFQNTRTEINLGYLLNHHSKAYLGYQSNNSTDIQDVNSSLISDFESTFYKLNFVYEKQKTKNILIENNDVIGIDIGFGQRLRKNESVNEIKENQFYLNLDIVKNISLNNKNNIKLTLKKYYLQSENYLSNELYRFGGAKSIRGFAENSLQAKFSAMLLTEYKHLTASNLYVNSILDYGIYKDPFFVNKTNNHLIGYGFGIGIITQNGLLKTAITNNYQQDMGTQIGNSMITINYIVSF